MTHVPYESLLLDQLQRWPELTAQDLTKALYQAVFGCGHFVENTERGLQWLTSEMQEQTKVSRKITSPLVEPLSDTYCRIHLSPLGSTGLSAKTLFSLFALSAEAPSGDMTFFRSLLARMEEMIDSGELPIDSAQGKAFLDTYRAAGCPPTHHSDAFRAAYAPAYRVIRSEYARFLPLFAAIDRLLDTGRPITVAIEGGSASGKSTLGSLLKKVYDCNLFHMDDFFLQMHQRTPERFGKPGGNVDYERFREEVLSPLLRGEAFSYRVFDCSVMALGDSVFVQPKQLNIVEGAYSMHPHLADAYDLSCFIRIDSEEQADRILRRNGPDMQKRFLTEWIPLEVNYFEATGLPERCDLVL